MRRRYASLLSAALPTTRQRPVVRWSWPCVGPVTLRREQHATGQDIGLRAVDQLVHALQRQRTTSGVDAIPLRNLPREFDDDVLEAIHAEHGGLRQFIHRHGDRFALTADEMGGGGGTPVWSVRMRDGAVQDVPNGLLEELSALVSDTAWTSVGEVYGMLSTDSREYTRDRHRSLRRLLERLPREQFALSAHGNYVLHRRRSSHPDGEIGLPVDPDVLPMDDEEGSTSPSVGPTAPLSTPTRQVELQSDLGVAPPPPPPSVDEVLQRDATAYADRLVGTGSVGGGASSQCIEGALDIRELTRYIPSFFVPATVALEGLPGYTVEHLEQLFVKSKSLQIVRIQGEAFVRLHGNFGYYSMDDIAATNERFREYELSTTQMMDMFGRAFPKPGTWHPLRTVVEKVEGNPAYLKQPYRGPFALLHFAQHQHRFAFTADNNGAVAAVPQVSHLQQSDSPCPVTCNELFVKLKRNPTDMNALEGRLSAEARRQLQNAFPSWAAFVLAHSSYFTQVGDVLYIKRELDRLQTKDLPLEKQLEVAYQRQDKKKIRSLRRRIAALANPDSPLLDSDVLARTVADFLPPDRPISLRRLLKSLPQEIMDVMPNSYVRFFKNNAQYFRFFEWRYATNFCISRPEVPLPDGVLRADYDELSLLAIIVRCLQKRNPQNTSEMLFFIPAGAREALKKIGGPAALLSHYPDDFVLVRTSMHNRDDAYLMTMVNVPKVLQDRSGAMSAEEDGAAAGGADEWADCE